MRKQLICAAATLTIALPVLSIAAAQPADEFYKGKNVDLYIGYSSGGGYDTYARLLARHMDRHLPGNPSIVPKNQPGAGSLVRPTGSTMSLPRMARRSALSAAA